MQKLELLLIISLALLYPAFIFAVSQPPIIINEICWMGSVQSANDEWIELYNSNPENINIDGWILKTADEGIKINLKGNIPAMGFFLLERTDDNSAPNIKADLIYQGALNNAGESLILIDSLGNIINQANFSVKWLFGDNKTKQTMEVCPSSVLSISTEITWQTSQNPNGTPGATNSIKQIANNENTSTNQTTGLSATTSPDMEIRPNPLPNSTAPIISLQENITKSADRPILLYISEILPSPEGPDTENEFIEIFNPNNFEADTSGFKIKDKIGAIKIFTIPKGTKISANGLLTFKSSQTKISLNNTGDGVELLDPTGQIIDSANYARAKQGQSWNKLGNVWQWTAKPTPNQANVIMPIQTTAPASNLSTTTSSKEAQLLANVQNYPPQHKNLLAVGVAVIIALSSAFIAWEIKKKSTEI